MEEEECEVIVRGTNGVNTRGLIMVHELSVSSRLWRGLTKFVACLLIGGFTIVVPMVHFLLPPLFVLIGMGLFLWSLMEKSRLESGEAVCPECNRTFAIPSQRCSWPLQLSCTHCKAVSWIQDPDARVLH